MGIWAHTLVSAYGARENEVPEEETKNQDYVGHHILKRKYTLRLEQGMRIAEVCRAAAGVQVTTAPLSPPFPIMIKV